MKERRDFFKSFTKVFKEDEKKEIIIRPPYYDDKDFFYKECINCDGICSTFCEENIIKIADDKIPYIDFSQGGCTYCDQCAINCPSDVLKVEYKKNIEVKIQIDMLECLSWNSTMCFSCKDPCLDNAIDFLGLFKPTISDACTSCGFCISYCPTNAITIK